ncbi:ABC transporter permease [Roseibium alexandrii]|uniref:ABC-type dipeptide/oligopeptide/nickel transport system, permease component n=1 Tax=Roseibium alexandrii (strain DSM 17067 / NCIMB 14079 / DFL-11) TaxID=244592 RepID=A0A5E8H4Z6_ROSAD|nr:ABC transporter permease [Roseibium alexandrii]EEE46363.2 ABC-type dipeptide/oligopeptide/nickel transport system, permease component [Roseibium alexandrii DFL-11]
MLRFTIERLVGMTVTMLLVSMMVFIIMELPPGDYADRYAFRKYSGTGVSVTEADIQAIRVELGLDKPMVLRYFDWIGNIVLRGDFGQAFAFETSVVKVMGDKVWLTLAILFTTLIITYVVSIPIGIYAAVKRGSAADYGLTIFSYLGLALPNFLLALILLYFANRWFGADIGGLFSAEYKNAPWSLAKAWDLIKHLWLPAVVLAWSAVAYQIQTMRATMSDELNRLSVTAARARGVPEGKLLIKYPARLAINPIVSTIGFDVNRIFSELPIVAAVLGLTELGELLLKAYLDLDMYVAGAILLLLTFMIVFMNFLSDILLAWLDPRIKLGA